MLDIDHQARSLVARGESAVQAPVEIVWWLASDLENWPTWQPNVSDVTVGGELANGTQFLWNSGGVQVTSRVVMCREPTILSWIDLSLGIESMHVWMFEGSGTETIVRATQTWSGWPEPALLLAATHFLDHTLYRSLAALKRRAEQLVQSMPSRKSQTIPS